MAVALSKLFGEWEKIRAEMLDAVKDLTAEQLDWLPEGGVNSIGDLLRHIAETENFWFGKVVLGGELVEVDKSSAPDREAIITALNKSHGTVTDVLEAQTDAEWNDLKYKYKEYEFTLRWVIWHVFEHECRHRGQILMMMRLQGIVPPEV